MTTRSAPASRAATAASKAALPPPITMMSHFSIACHHAFYSSALSPANAMYSLTTASGTRGQALGDQLLQLGAADGAADRQAAPVGLGAVLLVLHEPHIGGAQDLEPIGRNARAARAAAGRSGSAPSRGRAAPWHCGSVTTSASTGTPGMPSNDCTIAFTAPIAIMSGRELAMLPSCENRPSTSPRSIAISTSLKPG